MQISKLNHLMLDIETLALTGNAAVIAIGTCLFNPESGEIGTPRVYLPPTVGQKGSASPETIKFWLDANPLLLKGYLNRDPMLGTRLSWPEISDSISGLITSNSCDTLWANGIDFDIPILSSAFERTTDGNPLAVFTHRQRRDLRQWKFAAEHSGFNAALRPPELTPHDAGMDVLWQCRQACALWAYLSST